MVRLRLRYLNFGEYISKRLVRPEMFVDKPVDPEAFVEKVRKLIGD